MDGYEHIQQRINALMNEGGTDAILLWLDNVRSLDVLEFTEPDEGKAIRMPRFIQDYVDDLSNFFNALSSLAHATRQVESVFQLFCILNVSATLYPLIIRLSQRSRKAGRLTVAQIADELRNFVRHFMDDTQFRAKLGQEIFGNASINRILTEYEKLVRGQLNEPAPTIDDLSMMLKHEQTVEHVLPHESDFGFPSYGFANRSEYDLANHHLGNLTLLEKRINSRANNASVESKIRDHTLYHASDYRITRQIAAAGAGRNPVFSKSIIENRTPELAKFCIDQWPFWAAAI